MKQLFAGIGILTGFIALLFAYPLVGLLSGMFIGWVLELVAGSYVTDGLNLLFGTDRFAEGSLPQITGTIGIIGGFFKTRVDVKKEAK
ncbi:hypothetical protein [Bacillus sp. JJ722]|uniref:hypothetical protein n=1 Tax=Bacillus sp. JJ722 TaxID=3122973 RepID=UPI002FFFA462